jgi:hypothetical protein
MSRHDLDDPSRHSFIIHYNSTARSLKTTFVSATRIDILQFFDSAGQEASLLLLNLQLSDRMHKISLQGRIHSQLNPFVYSHLVSPKSIAGLYFL